jgi:REP element-mobilizing transposase RayT
MAQSLSQVYVHIVFSTKYRRNSIDDNIQDTLFEYIGGICKNHECYPVIVGGYKNHVHILCLLSRRIAQMKLLEEVKKGSSKWIKTQGARYSNFYWQNGYGIFSVNPAQVDIVERYIKNQEQHHSKKGFKEEFRALLKKYDIDFDERYVWD